VRTPGLFLCKACSKCPQGGGAGELSAQTGSVLMRELEADDLIVKGEPIRGKAGLPAEHRSRVAGLGIGPLTVAGPDGKPVQLLDRASIMLLERMLQAEGRDPSALWHSPGNWEGFEDLVEEWIGIVARGLAQAVVSAASIIDFEHVIIDGGLPVPIRERIVAATRSETSNYDLRGLQMPVILPGTVGILARALGAASLPLFDKFLIDRNTQLGGA